MIGRVIHRRIDGQLYAVAHGVLLAVVVGALTFLAAKALLAVADESIPKAQFLGNPATFLFAAAIYLVGHCFRSLRLALLVGGWRIGLRVIVSFHLMTAAFSLAVPLKLGEIYRVVELSKLLGSPVRAVATIWWERLFDTVAIVAILFAVLSGVPQSDWQQFVGVGLLALIFVTVTALAFFVLPDNLRRLSVLIIRRYDDRRSVPILFLIDRTRRAIQGAPQMVKGKIASLVALTALVWASELSCLAIVLRALGDALSAAPDALLSFLSMLTGGYTLLGVLGGGSGLSGQDVFYLAITQIPLVLVGLAAALYYVSKQLGFFRRG